jgi:hypothetical protein
MNDDTPDTFDYGAFLADQLDRSPFRAGSSGSLQIATAGQRLDGAATVADLRRRRARRSDFGVHTASLIQEGGVLHWEFGPGVPPRRMRPPPRRAGLKATAPVAEATTRRVMQRLRFTDLPKNEVASVLARTDAWLTPKQGLFEVNRALKLGDVPARPIPQGRILLLVHGTFSNVEDVIAETSAQTFGEAFLRRCVGRYDQVLAFNHPTLSVSALLNASELARSLRGSKARVDILCHSRGGLVARWFREAFEVGQRPPGRTIFVGSPLAGTGLAAPAKLKRSLDLLTNYAATLQQVGEQTSVFSPLAAPLTRAVSVLVSLVGSVFRVAASGPLDAGISLVPGLTSQARQGANAELLSLRAGTDHDTYASLLESYAFVTSNFEPEDPGWKFWRYFRDVKERVRDAVFDPIFEGENDLVVDTGSMTDLADPGATALVSVSNIKSFGTNSTVHHNNYFRQAETVAFFARTLGL